MRSLFLVLIGLFFYSNTLKAQISNQHAQATINCSECHTCSIPTFKNPCLKLFPDFRREGLTIFNTSSDAPELIRIDTLSMEYEASIFTHKLHAEMSDMAGGCISCHHLNPPGKILSCIKCHEAGTKTDLTKPGLKGAYHRQCLNCHKEWSSKTICTVCHLKKGDTESSDKTEYIGKSHEKRQVPAKRVYQTGEKDRPFVTFYHDEHNSLFGIKCADCHKNESCNRCHDKNENNAAAEKYPHENCINCHLRQTENDTECQKCHSTKESPPFSHTAKGWELNTFHKPLSCQSCHTANVFKKISTNCLSCHSSWKNNVFDHNVTGLKLDENHIDNVCSDCHKGMNFNKKPYCNDCHDNYSFPVYKPGEIIKY